MNKTKLVKIIAGSVAGVALGGALIYYNFVNDEKTVEIEMGALATDFTVKTYKLVETEENGETEKRFETGGDDFMLSEQNAQGKIVIVNFWATHCVPCREELPEFSEFQADYKDYVSVIVMNTQPEKGGYVGIGDWLNVGEPNVSVEGWNDFTFTFAYDEDYEVYDSFGFAGGVPCTAVIGKDGKIKFTSQASVSYEELAEVVNPMLPEGVVINRGDGKEETEDFDDSVWWKENALGIAFLITSACLLGGAITVSAIHTAKDKKRKQ
ncbi:MAG: TlpA family protein disulfide reductase [Clostridia bacterium]|nr:TlpA family protein disulfide reductase [Clostridia bacterium]